MSLQISGNSTISLSGFASIAVDNLLLDGNTISSTDTNGNIILSPNGSGKISVTSDVDLASGKVLKINNVSTLTATTLGSAVVNSSLTSVGTLTALRVDGNFGLGTGTFGASAATTLAMLIGTPPAAATANQISIYAKDASAGSTNATLALTTENAVAVGVAVASTHKMAIWINGVEYYVLLTAV